MKYRPVFIIFASVLICIPAIYLLKNRWGKLIHHDESSKYSDITYHLINNVDWENIRDNLREFTTDPHTAGTSENLKVAEKIAKIWRENGLEDVHFIKYNVLLNYPNYTDPNHVVIFDEQSGKTVFENDGISPIILPDEQGASGAGIQWLAYSPNGTVEADVVYCHYGSTQDFARLKKLGIFVRGKIALMRYDGQFRGGKIIHAQSNGAIGAILYSDPAECATDGTNSVYPQTVWMPSGGVQRGTLKNLNGDPLSPLYPSRTDLFHSRTIEEAREIGDLPSIPALPLSYSDAYQILSRLDGPEVPDEWKGSLNLTYRIGPGFRKDGGITLKFRMKVNSYFENREIQNVIGYIHGAKEPDEYVMLGNHYDAWVYGAIDPNSGTATLAEVASAFTRTMNETGWRPARTLVFCAWDAEEHGLVGSTEFVEDFANILSDRAVIYLNVDLIVANRTFNADTTPELYDVVVKTSKKIPNPVKSELDLGRETVYDTWIRRTPGHTSWLPGYPEMLIPGGGSDHSPFLTYLGVPVVDFRYQNVSQVYPLYHTLYETPFVNEFLYDPDHFSVHKAVGQYWAELARTFADAEILPLNVSTFARQIFADYVPNLKQNISTLKKDKAIQPAVAQLTFLIRKCQEFVNVADDFSKSLEIPPSPKKNLIFGMRKDHSALSANRVNQRLKTIERCFVNPRGSPSLPQNRHVLYSLSAENSYSGNVMASVYEQLGKFADAKSDVEKADAAKRLAEEISIIQYSVQCAINAIGLRI